MKIVAEMGNISALTIKLFMSKFYDRPAPYSVVKTYIGGPG